MLASSRKAAGHRNAWGNIHFSRSLSFAARLPGGRDRPPYNTRQTAGETGNFAFAADVFFPGTHLWESVGRACALAARPAGKRGVSGPMKTIGPYAARPGGKDPCVGDDACIVPQRCRLPQCLGYTFNFPRRLPPAAGQPGGRNRPPYNTRQTAGETGNFAFAVDVSFPGTHLRWIVGRAFTPAARPSGCRGVSGPMRSLPPAGGVSEAPRRAAPV